MIETDFLVKKLVMVNSHELLIKGYLNGFEVYDSVYCDDPDLLLLIKSLFEVK